MLQRLSLRRGLGFLALLLTLPLLVLGLTSAPASAATVVNYTFHTPLSMPENPCSPGDVLNLNGNIHIVITSTADNNGGYHMTDTLNSQVTGASILTHVNYVSNENKNDSWSARPPFPVVHTYTYDWTLVSKGATPNWVLHMTMHTTVTANGTPSAIVDNWSASCQG
jgi:hypothetical protein